MRKGENTGNQHFLLIPQCFQKDSSSGSFTVVVVRELRTFDGQLTIICALKSKLLYLRTTGCAV